MKANPWAEMDALMNSNVEPTGEEWFTTEQFAGRYGLTVAAAQAACPPHAPYGCVQMPNGKMKCGCGY